MSEKRKTVDFGEALHGQILMTQAIIDTLVEKGITTQEDLLEKIKNLQSDIGKKNN